MAEIDYKAKCEKLEEELAQYKVNGPVGLYYELNRFLNETISYTRGVTISSLVAGDEKGDKKFERTMALIKSAKEHVLDLDEIKNKLMLTGNEKTDKEKAPFIEQVASKRP